MKGEELMPNLVRYHFPTWTEAEEAFASPVAPEAGVSSPSPPEFWVESSSFLVGIAIHCRDSEGVSGMCAFPSVRHA